MRSREQHTLDELSKYGDVEIWVVSDPDEHESRFTASQMYTYGRGDTLLDALIDLWRQVLRSELDKLPAPEHSDCLAWERAPGHWMARETTGVRRCHGVGHALEIGCTTALRRRVFR